LCPGQGGAAIPAGGAAGEGAEHAEGVNADSLEEAEALARSMPIIESVRVYEAHSM
jgi:hypothetical protein